MIQKALQYYVVPDNTVPSLEDVADAVQAAIDNDCIIELNWNMKYAGSFARYIYKTDDPTEVYNNRIPHIYAV